MTARLPARRGDREPVESMVPAILQVFTPKQQHSPQKIANCLIVFIKEYICVLGESAVTEVIMDGRLVCPETQHVAGDA